MTNQNKNSADMAGEQALLRVVEWCEGFYANARERGCESIYEHVATMAADARAALAHRSPSAPVGEQTVLAELPEIFTKLREAYRRGASEQGQDAKEYAAAEAIMRDWNLPDAVGAPAGEQDERALFEAWAPGNVTNLAQGKFGTGYVYSDTVSAWQAWQARAAIGSASSPALLEPAFVYTGQSGKELEIDLEGYTHGTKFYAYPAATTSPAGTASSAPGGWKLVPVMPTLDMQQAALAASRSCRLEDDQPAPLPQGYELWSSTFVFRAMVEASPTATPSSAAQTEDAKDAARYRFLRKGFGDFGPDMGLHNAFVDGNEKMDAAIDAAMSAQAAREGGAS